jgi:hypothetical protein
MRNDFCDISFLQNSHYSLCDCLTGSVGSFSTLTFVGNNTSVKGKCVRTVGMWDQMFASLRLCPTAESEFKIRRNRVQFSAFC